MLANDLVQVRIIASGGFRIFDSENREIRIPMAKGAALIAYLAFSGSSYATRDKLAGLLWSESPNATARTSLRQCMHQLKSYVKHLDSSFLTIEKDSIALNRNVVKSDLDVFYAEDTDDVDIEHSNIPDVDRLLEGFDDLDQVFDEWLRSWRESVLDRKRSWLTNVVCNDKASENSKNSAAEILYRMDPSNETAARQLISAEAKNGNSTGVLKIYQRLWDTLDEEWGEEPSMELQDFVASIRLGLGASSSPTEQEPSSPPQSILRDKRAFLTVIGARILPENSSTSVDLEEFNEHVKSREERIASIITEHNGLPFVRMSGEVFGIFGHPNTQEDDTEKAANAAFLISQEMSAHGPGITGPVKSNVSIGLDSGLVYFRISESEARVFDLFGTAVDRVMELSRRTEAPAIFATERSIRRVPSMLYRSHLTRSLEFGGKTEAIVALESESIDPDEKHPVSGLSHEKFVGRGSILSQLKRHWEMATDGSVQCVSVTGEPGVGKTRAVTEFINELVESGESVHFVRCNREDRSAPLEPIQKLAESISPDTFNLPVDSAGDIEPSDRKRRKSVGSSNALVERLKPELSKLFAKGRSIIVFDDWQWADDASRTLLSTMMRELSKEQLLFVFTARSGNQADEIQTKAHKLVVPNMEKNEARDLAQQLLGRRPEKFIQQFIYKKSGGNPLFIEEICHAISHETQTGIIENLVEQLPGTLQALIVSRLERMNTSVRRILEAAAVHGDTVDLALIRQVAEDEVDQAAVSELVSLDVLGPTKKGDQLQFKHGITRDVIYNTIKLSDRRKLHTRFAEVIEEHYDLENFGSIAEQLAMHNSGAGNFKEAAKFAILAGDKAMSVSALDRARSQYAAAMDLIDRCRSSEENRRWWLSVAMRWALPCIYAPSQSQISILSRAFDTAEEFGNGAAMALISHRIGYIEYVLGHLSNAIEKLTEAEKLAYKYDNPLIVAEAIASRGIAYAAACEYDGAEADLVAAIRAKDSNPGSRTKVPILSSYARATLAIVKADRGEFDTAEALISEALDRVKGFDHAIESSICNKGTAILLWRGKWREALELADRSCHRSEQVQSPYLISMARCLYGYSRWKHSGDIEAVDILCAAADRLWTSEMRLYVSFAYGWIADACAETGSFETSRLAAERALELAKQGDSIGAAMACRALATLCAADPNPGRDKALAHLEDALSYAQARNSPHEAAITNLHFSRLYGTNGENAKAHQHIDHALDSFKKLGMDWHIKRALVLKNKLNQEDVRDTHSDLVAFTL